MLPWPWSPRFPSRRRRQPRVTVRRRSSARIRSPTTRTCTRSSAPSVPDRVVLISNFIPLQFPSSGPNFWKFDDNVLYEIMIDNTGDAVEDITFQFRFRTEIRNPNTFLYNTGPVIFARRSGSERPPVLQPDPGCRAAAHRRPTLLAANLHVLPANVGVSSIRDYNGQLGTGVYRSESEGARVFAGPA